MALEPDRLGERARVILRDRENALSLSAVSVWEMMIKSARGKLKLPLDVQTYVRKFLPVSRAALLDLSIEHVFALASLPENHRDPFDRIIIAQALLERMSLMTVDPRMLSYPIAVIDARL